MNLLRIIFWIILLTISCLSNAQNSISLSRRSPINLELSPSFNPGSGKHIITDNSQWLNYTTLVHPADPTFSITVEISSGSIPEGLELQLEASSYVGISKGKPGNPSRKIILSHIPRVLIANIGTCYTGSNRNEGHQLNFSFIVKDYGKLKSGLSTIYIQYTITQ